MAGRVTRSTPRRVRGRCSAPCPDAASAPLRRATTPGTASARRNSTGKVFGTISARASMYTATTPGGDVVTRAVVTRWPRTGSCRLATRASGRRMGCRLSRRGKSRRLAMVLPLSGSRTWSTRRRSSRRRVPRRLRNCLPSHRRRPSSQPCRARTHRPASDACFQSPRRIPVAVRLRAGLRRTRRPKQHPRGECRAVRGRLMRKAGTSRSPVRGKGQPTNNLPISAGCGGCWRRQDVSTYWQAICLLRLPGQPCPRRAQIGKLLIGRP